MKTLPLIDKEINNIIDILKYRNIYEYNFIIDLKGVIIANNEQGVLKKIVSRLRYITINGLSNKELYIYINYLLFKLGKKYIYTEYKIVIKGIGCNARCPMCLDWKRKGNTKSQTMLLYNVVDDIIGDDTEIKRVDILGGEPTIIYDDLLRIIRNLTENNIYISFTSNASLLDHKKIDELINSGLETFTFSIDFPNIMHDSWRSLGGAFEKILDFTRYIQGRGGNVIWSTVVGKFNHKYLRDFYELYDISRPNSHNFVQLENNYKLTNTKLSISKKQGVEIEKYLAILAKKTKILFPCGFDYSSNKTCHVPLYKKSYIIKNNKVNVSPCYIHANVHDSNTFTEMAILGKCQNICNSRNDIGALKKQ